MYLPIYIRLVVCTQLCQIYSKDYISYMKLTYDEYAI